MNLYTRTPQEVNTIKTQEVINIDIQPETIFEGYALQHEPNDLSAGTLQRKSTCTPYGMSPMTYLQGMLHSKSLSSQTQPILYH